MIWRMKTLIGLIVFLGLVLPLAAQDHAAVDSLFYQCVRSYEQGQYREALKDLTFMDRVYPNHSRTTASLLMQGKCLIQLNRYIQAIDFLQKLVDEHPGSRYQDDALYEMAVAYYGLNMHKDSVSRLLFLLQQGGDKEVLSRAARLSSKIMDNRMEIMDLRQLAKEVSSERAKAAVILRIARKDIEAQRYQSAKEIVQQFLEQYPKSAYLLPMQELLDQANEMGKGFLKIGVILPLTGQDQMAAQQLLDGVQYAVNRYNSGGGIKVELIIRDSESRVIHAIHHAQDLCENEGVVVIIGELTSDATAAVAAVAQASGVVLLSPAATENGISSIGSYVFQVNSNLKSRGELLANYAVSGLGLKTFAALYPFDNYGKSMRDAFAARIADLGAEMIEEKVYYEGAMDMGPQFRAIREAGIKRMIRDSLIIRIPREQLELMNEQSNTKPDNILYTSQTVQDLVDSTDLAITSIDGLFLPVYTEDLPYIITPIAFYNIKAQVFGGVPWHDLEILEPRSRYIDGVIFLSDFYVDPSNLVFYRFRDSFRKEMGKTPERLTIFGYDAAMMLLETIQGVSHSANEIRDLLIRKKDFVGIQGSIVFDVNRVNPSINLLQYRGERLIPIR